MSDCLFCKIGAKEIGTTIVYEDDNVMCFPDINPKAKVHLLVIPKKHIINLLEATDDDSEAIMHVMQAITKIAKQQNLSGFRAIFNSGESGGQEIFHLHAHILADDNRLPGF